MADTTAPEFTEASSQNKAREVLNGISHYRIDPINIRMTDTSPCKRGGEGVVTVGTIELPGEASARAKVYISKLKMAAGRRNTSIETLRSQLPRLKVESEHWPHGVPRNLVAEMIAMSPEALNQWCPRVEVAVKMLKWNRDDYEESAKRLKSFAHELSLMADLSHPNIVEMIGFVEDMENGVAWIILPWETNGNVRDFLLSGEWDLPERISLIQDTARGLEYLHSRQPPICHGDLKALNILVNSCYQAVITDFGSARIKQHVTPEERENASMKPREALLNYGISAKWTSPEVKFDLATFDLTLTGPGYSLRWTAPEVMGGEDQDLPSDMWAIGWIVWEIITGKIPFEGLNTEGAIIHHTITGTLPAIREDTDLSHALMLCALMSECWISVPVKRIHASAFRRKVGMIPSTTPSGSGSAGQKGRSALLLLQRGQIYELQGDNKKALSHYQSALGVATRTEDEAAKGEALRYLGEVYRSQSKHHEAEQAFMEAHDIFSRMSNDTGVAITLKGLGHIYWIQAKYHQAEKAFSEAHQMCSRSGHQLEAANALLGLAQTYKAEFKHHEAEQAYRDGHELHSRIGNDMGAAYALGGLGQIYRAQSRHREAEKVFVEAHEIHSRIGNREGAAQALRGLGHAYRGQSRFQEAEEAFNNAYEAHPPDGNSHNAGNHFRSLGMLYQDQGRQNEAEVSYRQALAAYDRADHATSRAMTLLGLGVLYHAQDRYSDAEEAVAEALAIGISLDNDHLRADAYSVLTQIFRSQSKHTEELESLVQAGGSLARIGQHEPYAASLAQLGTTHMAQGMYAEAEECYRHAQAIFSSMGEVTGEASVLVRLGVLYGRQGRYDEAEECFAQARAAYAMVADEDGEAKALDMLMVVYGSQGKFDDAKAASTEACEIYAQRGQPMSEICAMTWELFQGLELV